MTNLSTEIWWEHYEWLFGKVAVADLKVPAVSPKLPRKRITNTHIQGNAFVARNRIGYFKNTNDTDHLVSTRSILAGKYSCTQEPDFQARCSYGSFPGKSKLIPVLN
jgi:hypothetical protein